MRCSALHRANHGAVSLNIESSDWKLILAMGGAALAAIAMIAYAFFRPAEDPEEIERKRRLHLNQIGRIAEIGRASCRERVQVSARAGIRAGRRAHVSAERR